MLHSIIILNKQDWEENMCEIIYWSWRATTTNHICTIKIRRAPPARHDNNIDFRPIIITRTSDILPLSVVTADKGYDSEDNHVLVREDLHAFSVIPARYYEHVPIWKRHMVNIGNKWSAAIPNCCTINETRMKP